jgi:hypothetical protein
LSAPRSRRSTRKPPPGRAWSEGDGGSRPLRPAPPGTGGRPALTPLTLLPT